MKQIKRTILLCLLCAVGISVSANSITYEASEPIEFTGTPFDQPIASHNFSDGHGTITFENDVKSINNYAFLSCFALTSIILPNTIETIGNTAFYGCLNLTDITIPESVTTIGDYAFNSCSALTSIIIPKNVTSIGYNAFQYSTKSLTSIVVESGNVNYNSGANCNALIETATNTLILGCRNTTIPNTVTTIGEYAFYGCYVQSDKFINESSLNAKTYSYWGATICDTRTEDGLCITDNQVFKCVGNSSSVTIPNTVTSIKAKAFSGCSALTSITIPNTVTTIGTNAFSGCYIQSDKFINNSDLDAETNSYWGAKICDTRTEDGLCITDNQVFKCVGNSSSVTIPNTVTSIGQSAFSGCSNLTNVTISNTVRSIGNTAFSNCGMLNITFQSIPSLGENVFQYSNPSSVILDLIDSDKPFIGTSLTNYPAFTEVKYSRSQAKDTWGTIVLPFVPTDLTDKEFYELTNMTGSSLTFTKVDVIETGKPYLFKNTSSSSDFTLTKANPVTSDIDLSPNNQSVGDFTLTGSFVSVQLDGATNNNLYYLKNGKFWHAQGKINIAPFRAYIQGQALGAKEYLLIVEDDDVTAIPGILNENNEIDETEAIYDLSGRQLAAPRSGQVNIIRTKSGKTIKKLF